MQLGYGMGGSFKHALDTKYHDVLDYRVDKQNTDHFWMLEALHTAMDNIGLSNPNPSVGCVIVSNNKILSKGSTELYGGLHAEIVALNALPTGVNLQEATLYVTLEPCCHYGKQPPCLESILQTPIPRIVIGLMDPNPLVNGKSIEKLKVAGKEVIIGVARKELEAWHLPFTHYITHKSPFISLKWAQTLDGSLSDDWGVSQWISGSMARAYTHWLRMKYDAIAVGGRTFLIDSPELTARDTPFPPHRQPIRIVLDPHGRCLEHFEENNLNLEKKFPIGNHPWVYVCENENIEKFQNSSKAIEKMDHVIIKGLPKGKKPTEILNYIFSNLEWTRLFGRPLQSIMIEGGPKLLKSLIYEGYFNCIHTFVSPSFLGSKNNNIFDISLNMNEKKKLKLICTQKLGNDTLIEMVQEHQFF